MDCEMILNQDY